MAKHKVYKTNPLRKYIIFSLLAFLFIGMGYSILNTSLSLSGNIDVSKYDQTLYGVFEKNYNNSYAKLYTGAHQDSMDSSQSTKNIYYWGTSSTVNEMSNVIFADHCWKMYRTTDTGGVKLLYNGEVVDGKCLTTRPNHTGFSGAYVNSLSTSYYYGTSYTYNSSTNKFSLAGDITTGEVHEGLYTCQLTDPSQTCSPLVYVSTPNGSQFNTFRISDTHYSQIGSMQFSNTDSVPSYVGYSFGNTYLTNNVSSKYSYVYDSYSSTIVNNKVYYSDSISYDGNTNKYSLDNPQLISDLPDTSNLVGKYISPLNTTDPSNNMYYLIYKSGNVFYYNEIKNGNPNISSVIIGDSYTDNGNGTYTIDSPVELTYYDWIDGQYSTASNKYACLGNNQTCSNVYYFTSTYSSYYNYHSTENTYVFGSTVDYNNGNYSIQNTITAWNFADSNTKNILSSHHYTCLNQNSSCEKVNYIYNAQAAKSYFLQLSGGIEIEEALELMLTTNRTSSSVKKGVEEWYRSNLLDYDSYLEDTIFCNDRDYTSKGAWNPDGGYTQLNWGSIIFNNYQPYYDLSCARVTDRFSTNNSSAKLDYKIGLVTVPEVYLTNNSTFFRTGSEYWTMSPSQFATVSSVRSVGTNGGVNAPLSTYYSSGVRPVVSLKPGTEYSSGTGSTSDPYIIDTTP